MIEFLAHIVHIAANSQFDVILDLRSKLLTLGRVQASLTLLSLYRSFLPVEGRMDIDVPFLVQKAICGLYAVLEQCSSSLTTRHSPNKFGSALTVLSFRNHWSYPMA